MFRNTNHHGDWDRGYFEKCGGPGWVHVACAVIVVLMICIIGYLIGQALSLPTVYQSSSSRHCAKVIDPGGVYSCENMPVKFHHEWVR